MLTFFKKVGNDRVSIWSFDSLVFNVRHCSNHSKNWCVVQLFATGCLPFLSLNHVVSSSMKSPHLAVHGVNGWHLVNINIEEWFELIPLELKDAEPGFGSNQPLDLEVILFPSLVATIYGLRDWRVITLFITCPKLFQGSHVQSWNCIAQVIEDS